jgi:ATP-citrate lyase beta-subunit
VPRQKLSEYRAKHIISEAVEQPYKGWTVDAEKPLQAQLNEPTSINGVFVVKVDEGVKGRFKQGLVMLDVKSEDLALAVQSLTSKGYRWLIIEPQVNHSQSDERYISFMSDREGIILKYDSSGGVNIEEHEESIKNVRINNENNLDWDHIAYETGISARQLQQLVKAYKDNYFVFMEINPYLVSNDGVLILDAAVEVDDVAAFFVDTWRSDDFRLHSDHALTSEEQKVLELDANSPASFKLSLLEPNGSIFLLLSGGGASVVVADEIYNQGYGKQLANYGEYSGNPNTEETFIYTKALLQLLLNSSAQQKVLFIGGAVANFTDIAKTFAGVIHAINEVVDKLAEQRVKVFVRRGGPNQETGLAQIESVLRKNNLLGAVHGPEIPLTVAVTEALQEISSE